MARPRLPGVVPDATESVSQVWVLAAVQLRTPPPLFVIATFWAAGLLPPATPEKLIVCVARFSVGGRFCCGAPPKNRPLTTGFEPLRIVMRIVTCPARF